jgi:circadian clock protein KaiB
MMSESHTTTELFEKALAAGESQKFILSLFVAGMTPRSLRAIENARKLCEQHLKDRCELEVIDVYQQPSLAKDAQVIAAAAPTIHRRSLRPRAYSGEIGAESRKRAFLTCLCLRT